MVLSRVMMMRMMEALSMMMMMMMMEVLSMIMMMMMEVLSMIMMMMIEVMLKLMDARCVTWLCSDRSRTPAFLLGRLGHTRALS